MYELAISYAEAGFFTQAIDVANRIKKASVKANTLGSIALYCVNAGLYDQAVQVANSITRAEERNSTLHSLAQRAALAGFSNQALKIANTIKGKGNGWKELALSEVVRAYTKAREYDKALQVGNRKIRLYEIAMSFAVHKKVAASHRKQLLYQSDRQKPTCEISNRSRRRPCQHQHQQAHYPWAQACQPRCTQ